MHIKLVLIIAGCFIFAVNGENEPYADSISSISNYPNYEIASIGIGLMPPILTSTVEKDLWIGAAMEDRFYKSGIFARNFFIPNFTQLTKSIKDCPFEIPLKCQELVGSNLNLSYIAEIQYQARLDTLIARIQLNHISDKDLSSSFTIRAPASDPYRFISQTIETVFKAMGNVDPVVLKELYNFPTPNKKAYGCYVMGYRNINREEFKNAFYPLLRANELDPNFVQPLIEYGKVNLLTGRIDEAFKLVDREFPATTWQLELLRSEVYLKVGQIQKSFQALKNAEKMMPARTAELEYCFGNYYKKISASIRGISYIISAINRNPSVLKYYQTLGELYDQIGEYETSVLYFEKLVKLDPGNNDYKVNYGIALRESNKINEAISVFMGILEEHPDFYPARMNLGITYYQLGWFQKADKAFIANIALRQDTADSFLNLGILRILLGEQKVGKELIEAAHILRPKSVPALINLAKVEIYEGHLDQAEIYLKEAMALGGPDTEILLSLANIYEQLRSPEQEYKYLNKALELDPEDITILTRLAEHSMRNSDYLEAINYLLEVIDISPSAYHQRLLLAKCLLKSDDHPGAMAQFNYIADNFAHSADAILALGESYFENHLFNEAIYTCEPLLTIKYIEFETRLLLGKCFSEQIIKGASRRLNASEMAIFHLSKAMMLRPTDWEVHYWFGRYQRLVKKNQKLANEHLKMSSQLASGKKDKLLVDNEISLLKL